MAHDESVRKSARAMLLTGSTCEEVARTLVVPYATVKRWRKELQEERAGIESKLLRTLAATAHSEK